ncbi:MAG: hypothetical protein Q9169_004137 [Polycauliona sp. 2 TL-2023]
MSRLVSTLLYPLLLLITAPLLLFAIFSTFAASATLLCRVLLVYADLAVVLVKSQLLYHHQPSTTSTVPPSQAKNARPSRPPSRRRSSHSKFNECSGLAIYSAGTMERDFEGVGGWRIPNTEGEDFLWTSMNARLELPAFTDGHFRHHRRARTSGGGSSAAIATPMADQHQGRISPLTRPSGVGQEEYFNRRHVSKSTTALGISGSSQSLH